MDVVIRQIFEDYGSAAHAVRALEAAGFDDAGIGFVGHKSETNNAETGATAGAVLGGGAGLLANLVAVTVPGLGPLVAAGWLVPVLAGGTAGALSGAVLGGLADETKDPEVVVSTEALRRGATLVLVRTDATRSGEATAILARHLRNRDGAQTERPRPSL